MEPGFSASDNIDGDITSNVIVSGDTVSSSLTEFRSYTIYYDVQDFRGNSTRATRILNVIDTINPVITLNGNSELTLKKDTIYNELGATLTDNSGEVLTLLITNQPNMNVIGSYTVLYTATDSNNNTRQIGRLINVIAKTLLFQNQSTNIFEMLNYQENINNNGPRDSKTNWTNSTSSSFWKRGD